MQIEVRQNIKNREKEAQFPKSRPQVGENVKKERKIPKSRKSRKEGGSECTA